MRYYSLALGTALVVVDKKDQAEKLLAEENMGQEGAKTCLHMMSLKKDMGL